MFGDEVKSRRYKVPTSKALLFPSSNFNTTEWHTKYLQTSDPSLEVPFIADPSTQSDRVVGGNAHSPNTRLRHPLGVDPQTGNTVLLIVTCSHIVPPFERYLKVS